MGRLLWLAAALGAVGCGKVGATAADAAVDALPDALTCTSPQLACGASCVDPMTDPKHCGECDNACQATGESCTGGHCVDPNISCFSIKASGMPTGVYTLDDGSVAYCDVSTGKGWSSLIMNAFNAGPGGYTIIGATDLQNPQEQAAFIALYNKQGGFKVINVFGTGMNDNCCFKGDTAAGNTMLFLQAADVYPSTGGVRTCTPTGGYLTTDLYQFNLLPDTGANQSFATPPLPDNFFTTFPATTTPGCLVGNNPALFWKVMP